MSVKTTAAIAALAIIAICLTPVLAEPASADGLEEGRASYYYVYTADFTQGNSITSRSDQLVFVDGSDNHAAMLAYLKDPLNNDVTDDDKDIALQHQGETVHVYELDRSSYESFTITYTGTSKAASLVLEPYNTTMFYVTAGSEVSVTVNRSVSNTGERLSCYCYQEGQKYYDGTEMTTGVEKTISVSITSSYVLGQDGAYIYNLYHEIVYTVEGDGQPDGGAGAFAAICFVIAAITVALLVMGALKPKWSK